MIPQGPVHILECRRAGLEYWQARVFGDGFPLAPQRPGGGPALGGGVAGRGGGAVRRGRGELLRPLGGVDRVLSQLRGGTPGEGGTG